MFSWKKERNDKRKKEKGKVKYNKKGWIIREREKRKKERKKDGKNYRQIDFHKIINNGRKKEMERAKKDREEKKREKIQKQQKRKKERKKERQKERNTIRNLFACRKDKW